MDAVTEAADEGTDTVSANLENLTLTETAAADGTDNILTGINAIRHGRQ